MHFDGQSLSPSSESESASIEFAWSRICSLSFNHYHRLHSSLFLSTINNTSILIPMPSFIEIEACKAQREADHIQLQQEEEADLREQERLEKEEEERLAKEAEEARLKEVRRREGGGGVVQHRRAQKEAEARARAEEASTDEVRSVSGTIHIRRKRVMAAGELDMSRKVVGMDGSEGFPKIGVSCLRCKKRGEVCYWPLESKGPDGACHRCKGMKLACRVEEGSQSEVPTKKARLAKGKGKARAMPTVAKDQIPGLVAFFGRVDESLRLLVKEAHHTNTLLFNLGAEVAETTKLIGDVKNLLFKICRSQGLMGELPGELEAEVGELVRTPMPEWSPRTGGSGMGAKPPEPEGTLE